MFDHQLRVAKDRQAQLRAEAQRQAILQGSDFARTRALIHAQREKFLARNNGFEFGEQTLP